MRHIDWEDLVMRSLLTLLVYFATLAITALVAGMAQAAGASLIVQCAIAFLPGLLTAVLMWRYTR